MDIIKDQTDDLNAVITVKLEEKDYQSKVNDILKDYRKKAKMPGFRPGMVPFGMIKKMYGKSVLAEEVNKLLNDSLYKYIADNKIDILGNPIPKEDEQIDLDKQTDFEFKYELGLAPKFEMKISNKDKFTRYTILVSDEMLDKEIDNLRKRHGKVTDTEISEASDMLQGDFVELNSDGSILDGGIAHTSTISIEYVDDEKTKKQLIGLKAQDKLTLDPNKVSKGEGDMAAMLGIKKEQAKALKSQFQFTVQKINRVTPAALNTQLFDVIFGEGAVKTEQEFRDRIKKELSNMLQTDSDRKLRKDVMDKYISKLKLALPNEFLKKWLLTASKDLKQEQLDEEYDKYAEGLRWQLIENKLAKENNIEVKTEELIEHIKGLFKMQYAQYGMDDVEDKELEASAHKVLQNKEEAQRIHDQLFHERIMNLFKTEFTIKEKEISFDDFVNLASGKVSKFNLFNKFKF